ncbi:DMT family transporter [Prevotella corporis]|uniref:DMT family transporter n=1 Tax=Prevotella corporis TaxID=28128 RepID=UPI0023EF96C3|nr:DMT family transporter [Prevotella corporis]
MKKITTHESNTKAYIGMALSTLIIGLSFVFVKIALRVSSPLDLLAHRFNAATIALFVVFMLGYVEKPQLNRRQLWQLLSVSVFYPLLFFALQAIGLQYTTASEAGILSAITPVMTLILASVMLKERSSFGQIVGVIVSIAGTCYIFLMSGTAIQGDSMLGNILILLSVLSIVFYYIFGRKINHNYRSMDITVVMIILADVVFNVFALGYHIADGTVADYFAPIFDLQFIYAILYLGVLSSLVTSLFNNYALAHIPASQVAVLNNLTPVISVMGGIMILGEQLHPYHFIGAALVIIGVLATTLFQHKR